MKEKSNPTDKVQNSILIVDDDPSNISMLLHLLQDDYTIYVAKNGLSAIRMAQLQIPDLILLDVVMPEMDGYEVLEELRENKITQNIPVIFITGLNSPEDEEKGLSLEIADYISKPFVPAIVKLRVQNQVRLINYMRDIERLNRIDSLTGLDNRRSFNERLRIEWGRAIRESTTLSLILLDVDNFKHFNDTYGHLQGDKVLKTVADVFKDRLHRSTDFAARWGGEEFIVLLPNTCLQGAVLVAEQIREEIQKTKIILDDGTVTQVTVSAGVNEITQQKHNNQIDKFISDADMAMYEAKSLGRNRVVAKQYDVLDDC